MSQRAFAIAVVCLALAMPGRSQVRLNGYFSLDYDKGRAQTSSAAGSIGNLTAGIWLSGEWTPAFVYALEVQDRDAAGFEIHQAWAGFTASEAFRAKAGLFLVPFGKYNQSQRAFQTQRVQTPMPMGEIHPPNWRDLGLLVEGKIGFLTYAAYIGNGLAEGESLRSGQQFRDNNQDKGRGGRLGVTLNQNFEVGASLYSGRVDDLNTRSLNLKGFDASWSTENILILGEYAKADLQNPAPFAAGTSEGWFVQVGLKLSGLSPVLAYEKIWTEDLFHGAGFAAPLTAGNGISDSRSQWALGLTYALHPNILIKCEYDIVKDSQVELRNNMFRVQAAAHF